MKTKLFIVLAMFAALSLNSTAQEKEKRLGFELSGGPSFATNEFAEGLRMGFGFEGTFHYRILSEAGIYAGWGYNSFSTETSTSEANRDYEETGYVLGLQFTYPSDGDRLSYFLRLGALYNHIEIENDNGDILNDTGHGPGFQLAGGINVSLGSGWSLTPGLKYNSISGETEFEGASTQLDYRYLSARIGIMRRF
jgi:hypothetical protein